jgi:hypothetical protein
VAHVADKVVHVRGKVPTRRAASFFNGHACHHFALAAQLMWNGTLNHTTSNNTIPGCCGGGSNYNPDLIACVNCLHLVQNTSSA